MSVSLQNAPSEQSPLMDYYRGDENIDEDDPDNPSASGGFWLPGKSNDWFPRSYETGMEEEYRNLKRRLFLILTEPDTSFVSLVFFVVLIVGIAVSNILMILQTQDNWQFTPDDCVSCGGSTLYVFEDNSPSDYLNSDVPCVCAPAPLHIINRMTDYTIYFFTVEWIGRVLFYEPPASEKSKTVCGCIKAWFGFITDTSQVLDFLAIFPYYLESISETNGLVSLRLLRLFRVFQLIRLGQYNETFVSLKRVLSKSIPYFKLLMVVLAFAAAFFGSMVYWLEKGEWKYNEAIGDYSFMRRAADGVTEEISPFCSITAAFWWFLVTATTVGYGDTYPTSTGGKIVATFAMLTGVLVIAFPVSVFSDLWSKELKEVGALDGIESLSSEDPAGEVELILEKRNRVNDTTTMTAGHQSTLMNADDVMAISMYMKTIDESQIRMREILRKYKVET